MWPGQIKLNWLQSCEFELSFYPLKSSYITNDVLEVPLIHSDRDKIADIFQRIFANAFPWMKISEFRLKCYISSFQRSNQQYSSIRRHQAIFKPIMVRLLTHICVNRPQSVDGCQESGLYPVYETLLIATPLNNTNIWKITTFII